MELKSIARAEKVDFVKSAPRLGPADAPGTSDPSKVGLNRQKYFQIDGFAHASRISGVQKHVSWHLQVSLHVHGGFARAFRALQQCLEGTNGRKRLNWVRMSRKNRYRNRGYNIC